MRWAVARWSNFDGIKDEGIPRDFSLPAKEPKETPRDSMTSISSKTASKIQPADDEEEALRARLEAIGMHVGANFSGGALLPLAPTSLLMYPQTVQGQTSLYGNARCYLVRVQGPVGCLLGQTGR